MGWGVRALIVGAAIVGAVGCGQYAIVGGYVAIETHRQQGVSRSRRIMGRPETVEATHELAVSSQYPDYQSELIQPGNDDPARWPADYTEELDR